MLTLVFSNHWSFIFWCSFYFSNSGWLLWRYLIRYFQGIVDFCITWLRLIVNFNFNWFWRRILCFWVFIWLPFWRNIVRSYHSMSSNYGIYSCAAFIDIIVYVIQILDTNFCIWIIRLLFLIILFIFFRFIISIDAAKKRLFLFLLVICLLLRSLKKSLI